MGVVSVTLRLSLYGLALAAIIGALVLAGHWRSEARQARSERDAAVSARDLAEAETKIIDHYHTETRVITEHAQAEQATIEELPHAEDEIAPDRRDALCGALSRLRNGEPACDDLDSEQPAPDVP